MKKLNHNNKEIIRHPSDHKNTSDWKGLFRFLDAHIDYTALDSFLDLGAGMSNTGVHILKKNSDCRVVSVDTNNDFLKESQRRNPSIEAVNHDINKPLPFPDNLFGLVSCVGTLHYGYIKNPEAVLMEMGRVARRYILVDFLVKNSFYNFLLSLRHPGYNARKYTKKEIEEALLCVGDFGVVAARGERAIFPTLFPYSGREVFYLLEKKNK
ncbi:MAG: class I SAM-dependent methyltransferase [Candidatus Spechtbacterales bacterium]